MRRCRRHAAPAHQPKAEMNVVPYIDVMLVLLVIFMVTVPVLTQGVALELPKVSAVPLPVDARQRILTLSVTADGRYHWHLGEDIDIHTRSGGADGVDAMVPQIAAITAAHPDTQVYIRADGRTDYSTVVAGMAALQRGGVSRIGLLTEEPAQ
ncbi:ExbD/TolR family protein [Pseudothauera rhizosphaerae]|uniref:Tol-Pal system protein TolR n=1 Tax=Pseudothauera rhizosphaerae TaxID=2565932 RepID=A0A4V3WC17_9RHOO|nr:ExbD/TolR family protein [Pseudothauera rhizosphaerae]THF65382.1 ExbD/TolR family protein [Pseudothauera rhizosphaerae]